MEHLKITLLSLLVLTLASFTILQTTQNNKELIIGTWIPDGSPSQKWIFYSNGTCHEYDNGVLDTRYSYTIEETTSEDGKLKFSTLNIINIDDSNDTYKYDINGISETEMYLDYQGDLNTKLQKYTRQQ